MLCRHRNNALIAAGKLCFNVLMKTSEVPKLRRAQVECKITVHIDKQTDEIYRNGKMNGYDVAEIARRAVKKALNERREVLLTPADQI